MSNKNVAGLKNLKKGDVIYVERRKGDERRGYIKATVDDNYLDYIILKHPEDFTTIHKHSNLNDWFKDEPVGKGEVGIGWLQKTAKQLKKEIKFIFKGRKI